MKSIKTSVVVFVLILEFLNGLKIGVMFLGSSDFEPEVYPKFLSVLMFHIKNATKSSDVFVKQLKSIEDTKNTLPELCTREVQFDSIYFVTHGIKGGGIDIQIFLRTLHDKCDAFKGLILVNGFLTRDQRPDLRRCKKQFEMQPKWGFLCPGGCLVDGSHSCSVRKSEPDFPFPTLTIGGEMDGVVRITRIAEAFYTQKDLPLHRVIVIPGMSHSSITGLPFQSLPKRIAELDLLAEIEPLEAMEQVCQTIVHFVMQRNIKDTVAMRAQTDQTSAYFQPLLKAFVELEGNWFFMGSDEEDGSSKWAAHAQQLLVLPLPVGVGAWGVEVNNFRMLSDEKMIPPYFRPIHRAEVDPKYLNSTTISQLRFLKISMFDVKLGFNGFELIKEEKAGILSFLTDDGESFTSSIEIATKMRSRDYVLHILNITQESDTGLDYKNKCSQINQKSIDWAYAQMSNTSAERYAKSQKKLFVGPDLKLKFSAGPLFIWNYLTFEVGKRGIFVRAPFMYGSMKSPLYGAGTHYCKLLSPLDRLNGC